MSRSPPPQWHKYPPQGSSVGPPPMPSKHGRSPERERRPSPGYDREAEWRRFQEWEKRSRKSPPRSSPKRSPPRSQHRAPSPRKERSPVSAPIPPEWNRRSPPRGHRPPEWGRRSRSPPWSRRSPPRYGPPRGRTPPRPRSPPRWAPPPQEWDRQRGYPPRHSPPRWGPPPHWDTRRERYPVPHFERGRWPPHPAENKGPFARPNGTGPVPAPPVLDPGKPAADGVKMDEGSAEEDNLENYELPEYDAEVPLGQKYVIPVSGFFCKICHKFYNSESSAKITHCKSKTHYEKFSKWVSDKKEEAVAQKRSAAVLTPPVSSTPVPVPPVVAKQSDAVPTEDASAMEPPLKIPKIESEENKDDFETGLVVKEEVRDESDNETTDNNKYDPSEPTDESVNATPIKQEPHTSGSEMVSDTEKTPSSDVEYMEATLYNFRKMRVQQLKENLKKRDLPLHGLKPLLLKRLEKALLAEAAEAATAENEVENDEEKQDESMKDITEVTAKTADEQQAEEPTDEQSQAESSVEPVAELNLTMHESDIEVSNKKLQWITERELERELLQLDGVDKVISMLKEENKMGRKTVVEWSIKLIFKGDFPKDGLNFWMESHQKLPYRAELFEEE